MIKYFFYLLEKDENNAQLGILDSRPSSITYQALNSNNEINYNSNINLSFKNNELNLSSQHQLIDNTNLQNNYLENKIAILENNNNVNTNNNNNNINSNNKFNDSNVSSPFLAGQTQTQLANNDTPSENKNLPMEVT